MCPEAEILLQTCILNLLSVHPFLRSGSFVRDSLMIIFFQYLERRYSVGMRVVGCFFFVLTVVSIHFKNFWLCSFYFTFSTRLGFQPAEITRPSRSIDLNRRSMSASRRTKTLGNNRIITAGFSPFRFIKSNKKP